MGTSGPEDVELHAPLVGREWRVYEIKISCVVASVGDEDQVAAAMHDAGLQLAVALRGKQTAVYFDGHPRERKRLSDTPGSSE